MGKQLAIYSLYPSSSYCFIGYALYRSSTLDVLAFGDELATGLGVSVQKERRIYLLLATCLAGVATAVTGNIAF